MIDNIHIFVATVSAWAAIICISVSIVVNININISFYVQLDMELLHGDTSFYELLYIKN